MIINRFSWLIQKGLVYDLVKFCLVCNFSGWGLVRRSTTQSIDIRKVPVERSEIISRLKQIKGQPLSFEVEDSKDPVIETFLIEIGALDFIRKNSLSETNFVRKVEELSVAESRTSSKPGFEQLADRRPTEDDMS